MPNSFRFRLIPLLSTLIVCALGLVLGEWQTRRAAEKEAIAHTMQQRGQMPALTSADLQRAPDEIAFRRMKMSGQFVREWPLYLDNRPIHGVAGFYVMMPFKPQGSEQHVMVARGWQPRNPSVRTRMPELKTPEGIVTLDGVIRVGMSRVMQLGTKEPLKPGAILQNLDVADASKETGLEMADFILDQTSDAVDGLLRDWPLPSAGADKHKAYAFQWYALSLMAFIFFVVTGFRRGKSE